MSFKELDKKGGQRILKNRKINSKNLRNKAVISAAIVAIPTIMKLWPCHPNYKSNIPKQQKKSKNNKDLHFYIILLKNSSLANLQTISFQ